MQSFTDLHSSFLQLGQIFSTRIDIVPKEYIEQLKLLQDNVPAFSGAKAREIIETELGKPIEEIFDTFDSEPLAGTLFLMVENLCLCVANRHSPHHDNHSCKFGPGARCDKG